MKKSSNALEWGWSEDKLQIKVFTWFNNNHNEYSGLLFHVPNGGRRTGFEAKKFKFMGLVAGVADLLMFVGEPCAIELKKPDGSGKQNDEQKKWELQWKKQGHQYVVLNDLEEIKAFINKRIENYEWEQNQLNM